MARLNTYVPDEVLEMLRAKSEETMIPQARLVREALVRYLGVTTAEPPQKVKRNPALTRALKEEEQAAVFPPTTIKEQARKKAGMPEGWFHRDGNYNCPHGMPYPMLEFAQCAKCAEEKRPWRNCKDDGCEKIGKLHPWHEVEEV